MSHSNIKLPYRARGHIDDKPHQIKVFINDVEVNPCRLFKEMSVTFSEGDSAQASFQLLEQKGQINILSLINQPIRIVAQDEDREINIYTGIIDAPNLNLQSRQLSMNATSDRGEQLNNLSRDFVNSIGFWCQSILNDGGDEMKMADEVQSRLSTTPSCLDFDANGKAWLTPWKPKETPDFVLNNCAVYKSMDLEMGAASSVINTITIDFANRFDRFFHREIGYTYQYQTGDHAIGPLPCWIGYHGPPPKYDDVYSAATGAGWAVGRFQSEGAPQSGWYDCNGVSTYYNASDVSYEYNKTDQVDASGRPIMQVSQGADNGSTAELYCMRANWKASKRWIQSVEEKYKMTLTNAQSVKRYGKRAENLSFTLTHDVSKSDTPEACIAQYWEENDDYAAPYGTMRENGDYITQMDNVIDGEYDRAWSCAFQIARTKILESHRNNKINLDTKFIPDIDLRHTALVNLKQFKGLVKIQQYTHHINFSSKKTRTSLTGAFFQNPQERATGIDELAHTPTRPVLPVSQYQKMYVLGNYIVKHGATVQETEDDNQRLCKGEQVEDQSSHLFGSGSQFALYRCNGFIRKETGHYFGSHKVMRPYAFRISTPDIEAASRDTLTQNMDEVNVAVNIFNNDVEVVL